MRLATFNLESLDLPPRAALPLETRARLLRPALERLEADILCLQEVNAQHVPAQRERVLKALDLLLSGTRYQGYHRAVTLGPGGQGPADVHNLVTLSRFPVLNSRQVLHQRVAPALYRPATAEPPVAEPEPVRFDRPLLVAEIAVPGCDPLTVVNVHLRAPLATVVTGQKLGPTAWKSVGGWAEGYFLAAVRRVGQALELRLLLEALFDANPGCLIAAAGDFNAEDHEMPLRIVIGAEEETGNSALAPRSLVVLDRALAEDRRWSVLHHGRRQMLDHVLASQALYGAFRTIEVHNERLADELVGYGKGLRTPGSYHAPVVAEFEIAAARDAGAARGTR